MIAHVCFNFVCLASPHREFVFNAVHASHIDTSVLSDETYKLIPESDRGDPEVQVNAAELTEAPNQSSE